jgi:FkbM family methyltransferase
LRQTFRKANKLRRILSEPAYRRALKQGVAATTEHEDVTFPREYGTVIDVGANRGQFALFALHRFPRAELRCFEPLPEANQKLTEVVGGNPRVHIEMCAIGAAADTLSLNVTRSDDSSSLLRPTALQLQTFPHTDSVSSIEVNVKTLDATMDFERLAKPFLLKIDVQGYELDVLRGASRLLAQDGDLLIESSFAELYAGQPLADEIVATLQGDFLFAR